MKQHQTIHRILAAVLALAMLAALTGCGSKTTEVTNAVPTVPETTASAAETGETAASAWTPTQPIHIVGQSEAGSGADLFTRALQPWLQEELGVAVVVENAPGSGGKIACTQVWNASPDGYTLLAHSSPLTTVTQISKDGVFNVRDFKHIICFDSTPYAIVVKKDGGIDSVDVLLEACKAGKVSNANSGIGGAMYLQSMIMKDALGVNYAEVPYNGSSPSVMAVMNKDVTMSIVAYDYAINNQDELTILAILADERLEALPDVPTMKELGYDFPTLSMRRGIVAPPNTPDDVVERLVDAFAKAVENPDFVEYTKNSGINMEIHLGQDYQDIDEAYYDTVMEYVDYLG